MHFNNSSESNNIAVSVIIVNWNSGIYLQKTIESLYKNCCNTTFELIVLDNNSNKEDASYRFIKTLLPEYKNSKIILNNNNFGFAKACNIGIKQSCGEYILLLNPDVKINSDILLEFLSYMQANPKAGILGPKVLNPDNSFQHNCLRGKPEPLDVLFALTGISKLFPNKEYLNKFSLYHLDKNIVHNTYGLSGCCMMIRKDVLKEIGLLDESFFLYQEDTDLCLRVKSKNWEVIYYPKAIITHFKGSSTNKRLIKTNYYFFISMIKFFIKYYFDRYNLIQRLVFYILISANLILRIIKNTPRTINDNYVYNTNP